MEPLGTPDYGSHALEVCGPGWEGTDRRSSKAGLRFFWTVLVASHKAGPGGRQIQHISASGKEYTPAPPNVALLRALWSLLDGIWGVLKGSWGVLAWGWVWKRRPQILHIWRIWTLFRSQVRDDLLRQRTAAGFRPCSSRRQRGGSVSLQASFLWDLGQVQVHDRRHRFRDFPRIHKHGALRLRKHSLKP